MELGSFQGLRNRFIRGRGRQQETSHRERGSSRDNKNDRDKETNRNLSTPGGEASPKLRASRLEVGTPVMVSAG